MAQFAPLKPTTILIVEDQAIVRLEFAEWLTEMGLLVLASKDADEAIEILDTHPEIAILLTDIRMPGSMDGLRLAHHVRGRWPPVKIIIVSGFLDTPQSALPMRSLFVPKPVERAWLWQALAHMIDDSQPDPAGWKAAS